jgi:protein-disulfide isomerase
MRYSRVSAFLAVMLFAVASSAVDGSSLKPPAGARGAIVVFEDLECPSCAQAAPLLKRASEIYNVPLVVHDIVNTRLHPWSMDATVAARYIEQKHGRAIGDQFREYIFQCQPQITKANVRSYMDKFCAEHKIDLLPFAMDPDRRIAAALQAEQQLAERVQIAVTPTIFVVTASSWTEVSDRSQLYSTIERMVPKQAAPAPKTAPAKKGSAKKS